MLADPLGAGLLRRDPVGRFILSGRFCGSLGSECAVEAEGSGTGEASGALAKEPAAGQFGGKCMVHRDVPVVNNESGANRRPPR